ncbi:transmembrane protein 179-like isoform X1 [Antennarius striatus]|uniref:transmembrane protein 179-like isoform X1 n=1 Tax=Antennarius striatus TaxID=241820 RepID=UPI0035AF5B83
MELDRRLLLAHCAAHALSILGGLLVVIPMALNGSAFKGRCALFSTGYWRTEDGVELTGQPGGVSHLVLQQWGPLAACQAVTFVGIFTVLYGAAQGWRGLVYLHGRHDDTLFSSFLTLVLSVCMLFLSGGAGVILSLGLVSWCDTITDDSTKPFRYSLMTSLYDVIVEHPVDRRIINPFDTESNAGFHLVVCSSAQLCRVPVCSLLPGRGHVFLLHGAQPSTGVSLVRHCAVVGSVHPGFPASLPFSQPANQWTVSPPREGTAAGTQSV